MSLRDELRKQGLISGGKARKLDRADRAREHQRLKAEQVGDEAKLAALVTEQEQRRQELAAAAEAARAAQAEEVARERRAREAAEARERAQALLDSNRVPAGRREQDWRVVTRAGRVTSVPVSHEVADRLQHGLVAILERDPAIDPSGRLELVEREAALTLEDLEPGCLRFLVNWTPAARSSPTPALPTPALSSPPAVPTPAAPLAPAAAADDFLAGL